MTERENILLDGEREEEGLEAGLSRDARHKDGREAHAPDTFGAEERLSERENAEPKVEVEEMMYACGASKNSLIKAKR